MTDNFRIELYNPNLKVLWDDFVKNAKNGHFMHHRDYMEYHKDRFEDFSLLFFNKKNILRAIFPANRSGSSCYSHQGLSFAGLILSREISTVGVLELFDLLKEYLSKNGINELIYKPIPYIYHKQRAEEDLYALYRNQAKLFRRDISSTIDYRFDINFQNRRKRLVKKALKNEIQVEQVDDLTAYWSMLTENLEAKYKTKPTHNLEDITYLKNTFPDNIKLFQASLAGNVLAGVLVFESDTVAHAQYISVSDDGRLRGALDLVFEFLINSVYRDSGKSFFDFGISTEDSGQFLNEGLIEYKEGFSASATILDQYRLDIS